MRLLYLLQVSFDLIEDLVNFDAPVFDVWQHSLRLLRFLDNLFFDRRGFSTWTQKLRDLNMCALKPFLVQLGNLVLVKSLSIKEGDRLLMDC